MDRYHLDRLDDVARALIDEQDGGYGLLSVGERLYVALAANRADLLKPLGYTIAGALDRLGADDTQALASRWHHR